MLCIDTCKLDDDSSELLATAASIVCEETSETDNFDELIPDSSDDNSMDIPLYPDLTQFVECGDAWKSGHFASITSKNSVLSQSYTQTKQAGSGTSNTDSIVTLMDHAIHSEPSDTSKVLTVFVDSGNAQKSSDIISFTSEMNVPAQPNTQTTQTGYVASTTDSIVAVIDCVVHSEPDDASGVSTIFVDGSNAQKAGDITSFTSEMNVLAQPNAQTTQTGNVESTTDSVVIG